MNGSAARQRVLAALGVVGLAGSAAGQLVIAPYVQNPGPTEMTIRWSAREDLDFSVRYGAGETLDRELAVDTWHRLVVWHDPPPTATRPATLSDTRQEYLFAARLTGLRPGTAYRYEVVGPASRAGGRFTTIPEEPARITFIAYGDTQTGSAVHRRLAAQFAKHNPAFILHAGDLASSSWHGHWKPEFFDPAADVLRNVPVFPTIGNHDGDYRRYFSLPNNGRWYSFDYGNLHVVSLECDAGRTGMPQMLEWLERDLAATRALWRIALYHRPTYDCGAHQSGWGRKEVLPLFRKHGVDLTLSGHSHTYQRFRPMYTVGENQDHPITFMVTAGGGGSLMALVQDPHLAAARMVHHYVVFTVEGDRLAAEAFDLEGRTIDSFAITKRNGRPDAEYLKQALPEDTFGELRRLVQPSLRGFKLDLTLLDGKPVPLTFPVTAGEKAMTFEVRLESRATADYEMAPVRGRTAAGGSADVAVAIRLKDPAKYRSRQGPLPVLRLECVFEIDGRRASVYSSRLQPLLPAATQPGAEN